LSDRPGEFDLIAKYFAPLAAGNPGALGLTDDAATLDPGPGNSIVVTADALVEGVHFLPDDPADSVASKLLRVNLSDLAAMGAEPMVYLITMALPRDWREDWVAAFAGGLASDQDEFSILMAGGDTVSTPGPLTLSLTAIGRVPAGSELRRTGAQPGDHLWVSGTVGDAGLGLRVLKGDLDGLSDPDRAYLIDRFRRPRPRVALGDRLRGIATAAIDVSDGLVADLGHICDCSKVGAAIHAGAIPLSPAARAAVDQGTATLAGIATAGDDFELLFTAPEGMGAHLREIARASGIEIAAIGSVGEGDGVRLLDEDDTEIALESRGFRHF
jgi:thiamine-monophosphate kinase